MLASDEAGVGELLEVVGDRRIAEADWLDDVADARIGVLVVSDQAHQPDPGGIGQGLEDPASWLATASRPRQLGRPRRRCSYRSGLAGGDESAGEGVSDVSGVIDPLVPQAGVDGDGQGERYHTRRVVERGGEQFDDVVVFGVVEVDAADGQREGGVLGSRAEVQVKTLEGEGSMLGLEVRRAEPAAACR